MSQEFNVDIFDQNMCVNKIDAFVVLLIGKVKHNTTCRYWYMPHKVFHANMYCSYAWF